MIIEDILAGIENQKNVKADPDRKAAIADAIKAAKKGDIVLLCGKGHETYQILNTGKIHFDEREVVREIIANII
jgi:UDP-N-acetylmuramoyl-L-alanyl-D-glutamate--2,6-diaminopimelate ligase